MSDEKEPGWSSPYFQYVKTIKPGQLEEDDSFRTDDQDDQDDTGAVYSIEEIVSRTSQQTHLKVRLFSEWDEIIDLVLVGNVNKGYRLNLIEKAEPLVSRRIRYLIHPDEEAFNRTWEHKTPQPFLIWSRDENGKNAP